MTTHAAASSYRAPASATPTPDLPHTTTARSSLRRAVVTVGATLRALFGIHEQETPRFITFLSLARIGPGATLDLRIAIPVLCGDHGTSWSVRLRCDTCGGYAEPLPNLRMQRHLKEVAMKT